ncbi:hypothetical protein [Salinibaculum rarum]|uniref:hypothetical protein n=1 Tax=Salinibaculum rarum TaxID=3058903 RepID=UPI00265F7ED7|nr:hypothetical protein [Salinibaculum sp. KK48]
MTPGRVVVFAAVGLMVLATAATGTPLWTVPDRGGDQGPLGQGTAEVTVVSMPDTATLDPGRQGGNVYYLRVPSATVDISQLRGNPIVTYSISIEGLGYGTSAVNGLERMGEGQANFSIESAALEGERISNGSYEGELRLVLRGDNGETVLYSEPITVEVTA